VVRMHMEWAKEKADRGCEKLAHYLKTRGKDENMFLSVSKGALHRKRSGRHHDG